MVLDEPPTPDELEWCHGCQGNVEPVMGDVGFECPVCSYPMDLFEVTNANL